MRQKIPVFSRSKLNSPYECVTAQAQTWPCGLYSNQRNSRGTGQCVVWILELATMSVLRRFKPLLDRVLVERFAPEVRTKGGIMLPEKAIGKVLDAKVVAVGPGIRNEAGSLLPMSVNVGDRVLLPEYGGTKITLDEKEYHLFRDGDILAKYEGESS
ncbi:10 kDa heat shock protein, mitochondrial-like isoform X1 [Ptychodera flava]|uniref:10 kDa heat shock protein, mitochondrial-like isoform X1 n=1 Tax=Ptychodera flava TaxID=63121 RepID=UPI00396A840E